MKEYVYFCKNCKRLEADTADNRSFRCEECGGKFQPLHVTVPEWKAASPEERRNIVNRSVRNEIPRNNMNKKQNINTNANSGSQESATDKIKAFIEKISVGEEGKNSKLAIVGFIMSFLGFFSIFGLAAGIIDLLKKDGRKKGFSIATICISVIMLLGSIGLSSGTSKETATDGIVAETTTEETTQETILDDNLVVDITNITDTTNIVSEVEDNSSDLIDIGEDTEIATVETTEESEPEVTTRTLYTTSKVNIREQPNTDCAVLGKAENGQEVLEYEAGADGWSRVACGGVEGYIKSEFLSADVPNTSTAQATEPTTSVATTEPVQSTPAPVAATESVQNTPVPAQEATDVVASVPKTTVAVAPVPEPVTAPVATSATGGFVVNGKNGKIHKVGGCTKPPTDDPRYCQTYEEAEAISISVAPNESKRRCGNCYK